MHTPTLPNATRHNPTHSTHPNPTKSKSTSNPTQPNPTGDHCATAGEGGVEVGSGFSYRPQLLGSAREAVLTDHHFSRLRPPLPCPRPVCHMALADHHFYRQGKVEMAYGVPLLTEFGPDARAAQGKIEVERHPLTDHHVWAGGQAALLHTTTFGDTTSTSTKLPLRSL
eukprot:gene14111-biopygen3570